MTDDAVMCCFCAAALPEPEAVLIVVYPTVERDETQSLYAHRLCLVQRLRPELPLHPSLEADT